MRYVECFAQIYLQKHSSVRRFLLIESICDLRVEFVEGRDRGVVGSEAMLVRGDGEMFCERGEDEALEYLYGWTK